MTWDTNSKKRLLRRRTAEAAKPSYYAKKLNFRVVSDSDDKSAEQLAKLEAENAELRRRAVELALEVHALRGG
jgi:hypothetical protein